MPESTLIKKVCPNGHTYYKTSDCPVCPVCEKKRKPDSGFMAGLSAPARRALENLGIKSIHQLTEHTEAGLLELHGFGPSSLPVLRKALKAEGLAFRKK